MDVHTDVTYGCIANGEAPLQWTFDTCGGDALHPYPLFGHLWIFITTPIEYLIDSLSLIMNIQNLNLKNKNAIWETIFCFVRKSTKRQKTKTNLFFFKKKSPKEDTDSLLGWKFQPFYPAKKVVKIRRFGPPSLFVTSHMFVTIWMALYRSTLCKPFYCGSEIYSYYIYIPTLIIVRGVILLHTGLHKDQ
jgi:hypothetical protein